MKVSALPRPQLTPRSPDLRPDAAGALGPVADQVEHVAAEIVIPGFEADGVELDAVHTTVAALYVDPHGVYANLPGVEVWDEARDARTYAGPWPVVAHPPCARWSRWAGFTEAVFRLTKGEDGGCFASALEAVRTWGGVIVHPAYSEAWDAYGLPEPTVYEGWTGGICGGWSAYVEQGRYGHKAKKATWLYAYGVDPPILRWGHTPDQLHEWKVSWHGRSKGGPELTKRERSATPVEFRDVLIGIAMLAGAGG